MFSHFDKILSKFQCGFRKSYSAQQCLIAMAEKLRQSLDKGDARAVLLTDLSKILDYLLVTKIDQQQSFNEQVQSFK